MNTQQMEELSAHREVMAWRNTTDALASTIDLSHITHILVVNRPYMHPASAVTVAALRLMFQGHPRITGVVAVSLLEPDNNANWDITAGLSDTLLIAYNDRDLGAMQYCITQAAFLRELQARADSRRALLLPLTTVTRATPFGVDWAVHAGTASTHGGTCLGTVKLTASTFVSRPSPRPSP